MGSQGLIPGGGVAFLLIFCLICAIIWGVICFLSYRSYRKLYENLMEETRQQNQHEIQRDTIETSPYEKDFA